MLVLNTLVPCVGGDVDSDWMLRLSFYGYDSFSGMFIFIYGVGKRGWAICNGLKPKQN